MISSETSPADCHVVFATVTDSTRTMQLITVIPSGNTGMTRLMPLRGSTLARHDTCGGCDGMTVPLIHVQPVTAIGNLP
ncbi:hypothetical protein BRAO375_1250005 [Bradyrhizobium sp. ORS 375]|nr:hypothetical protein BRAO375_1250005 [Bradyrhizobium sp. ORS 375]